MESRPSNLYSDFKRLYFRGELVKEICRQLDITPQVFALFLNDLQYEIRALQQKYKPYYVLNNYCDSVERRKGCWG